MPPTRTTNTTIQSEITRQRRCRTRGRVWNVTAMALAMFGMLFWLKLRMSVDIPKVAYAEPDPALVDPEQGLGGLDTARTGVGESNTAPFLARPGID